MEGFELDEEQANQLSNSLGFLCGEFESFLKETNPEKSSQGVAETLLSFITEKDWEQAHIPPQYRREYEWNFSSLNILLGNSCEWDIPFLYFSRGSKINNLTFPTLEMHREFINSLNIPLTSSKSFLQHIQQPNTYPFETASILQKGITAALLKEFEILGIPEYSKEVGYLTRFFSGADLLECMNGWIRKVDDETGEFIDQFDSEREYTWEDFLLELNVNFEPLEEVICRTNDLEQFMDIYRGIKKIYFKGIFKRKDGAVISKTCYSWDDYIELIKESS